MGYKIQLKISPNQKSSIKNVFMFVPLLNMLKNKDIYLDSNLSAS